MFRCPHFPRLYPKSAWLCGCLEECSLGSAQTGIHLTIIKYLSGAGSWNRLLNLWSYLWSHRLGLSIFLVVLWGRVLLCRPWLPWSSHVVKLALDRVISWLCLLDATSAVSPCLAGVRVHSQVVEMRKWGSGEADEGLIKDVLSTGRLVGLFSAA